MESLDSIVDSTPAWTRPEKTRVNPLRAVPWLGGVAVIGLSLVTGMLLAAEGSTAMVVTIPQPVVVAAASSPVNVTVAAPVPPPIALAPTPMRMAVPMLAAECFGRSDADGESPACSWDNGFPAISNDGKQVAELVIDGPMGPTDVSVVFHDVATNQPTRTITISKEGELDDEKPQDPTFRAKVIQRTATAQRVLEAGKFRAMHSLGTHKVTDLVGDPSLAPEVTGAAREIHSEWSGVTMRLVDPSAHTELFRHTFSASAPTRSKPDEECGGWSLVTITGWWDPQSRVVVGQLLHHHGGCMCGETTVTQAFSF